MGTASFIASRLNVRSTLATVCIAVSYLVMIVAMAVSAGFRREIRKGAADISGDIQVVPIHQDYLSEDEHISRNAAYLPYLEAMPEVEEVMPVIYRAGLVKAGDNIHGVMFKAVPNPADTGRLAVSIPVRLSELLSLEVGDRMLCYFVGESVKLRNFTVASVYEGILGGTDQLVVYGSLADFQRLNGWSADDVSAFELRVKPQCRSRRRLTELEAEAGFRLSAYRGEDDDAVFARSSASTYSTLFGWLDVIDLNVLVILILMTVVAGFNMISGLLIILFENISTIGLLKALGMKNRDIRRVFLNSASRIVLLAMLVGNALALTFCLVQGSTHLISLDPENYFVSYVPVSLNPLTVLLTDALSYSVIMLLLLIPTHFISKVDPADTVRVN